MNHHTNYHQSDIELVKLSMVFADPAIVTILTILTKRGNWLKSEDLSIPGLNDLQLHKHINTLKRSGLLISKTNGNEKLYAICTEKFENACQIFLRFFNDMSKLD